MLQPSRTSSPAGPLFAHLAAMSGSMSLGLGSRSVSLLHKIRHSQGSKTPSHASPTASLGTGSDELQTSLIVDEFYSCARAQKEAAMTKSGHFRPFRSNGTDTVALSRSVSDSRKGSNFSLVERKDYAQMSETDDYDPAKPEYVQAVPSRAAANQQRELLREQLAKLEAHIANRRGEVRSKALQGYVAAAAHMQEELKELMAVRHSVSDELGPKAKHSMSSSTRFTDSEMSTRSTSFMNEEFDPSMDSANEGSASQPLSVWVQKGRVRAESDVTYI